MDICFVFRSDTDVLHYVVLHEKMMAEFGLSIYSAPSVLVVFFLGLFFLVPVERARGCSRILRISSSSIFLSDLIFSRSTGLAAASLVRPFLVMAVKMD